MANYSKEAERQNKALKGILEGKPAEKDYVQVGYEGKAPENKGGETRKSELTDIKNDIVHILERLDYADGTWDSIRYVKGGAIDKRRNK